MKKRLRRQGALMFVKIMSVFLLITVAVSALYVYITYSAETEILKSKCSDNFQNLVKATCNTIESLNISSDSGLTYNLENSEDVDYYAPDEDDYITYAKYNVGLLCGSDAQFCITSDGKDIISGADNALSVSYTATVNFSDEQIEAMAEKYGVDISACPVSFTDVYNGIIDYDSFRASMSDEDYKEIVWYLSAADEDGLEYYELICTEFYGDCKIAYSHYGDTIEVGASGYAGVCIPKTVQIVKTNKNHDWYVQDEVICEYSLNPETVTDYVYTITDQQRNVISEDFVNNKYDRPDLKSEFVKAAGINYTEYSLTGDDFFESEPFTYIYRGSTSEIYSESEESYHVIQYVYYQKVNVLQGCIDRIGITFLYTFILFAAVGVFVWLMCRSTLKKQLELEQRRRNLTNSMAHDIKTPLFVISGNAENMLECAQSEDEKYYAHNIIERVASVNGLIHNMLDLSALDSDNFRISRENIRMGELVQSVLDSSFTSEQISCIHTEISDEAEIYADRTLIKCVVQNLVDNAFKYTDDQSSVSIRVDSSGFSVSNSVDSFKSVNLKKVWEPYNRQAYSHSRDGNGLGLSIVRSILELHGYKYYAQRVKNTITFGFKEPLIK